MAIRSLFHTKQILTVMATVILLNKPKIQNHKELVTCDRGNEMEIKSSCHVAGENFGVKIWISV